ncbi:MAG: NAD(P)-dependent oxidoreductase [Actinomycetota bacterium]|nr:NAD(P)-dependent oxidoreductase [Actinomycetota bacterium]
MSRPIAVAPDTRQDMHEAMSQAVESAGGQLVDPSDAEGLVWADPARPDLFPSIVDGADRLEWIQLPYAGVEPFAHHLDDRWTWTCGKGVYAPAVAESVMALALALVKNLPAYSRADTWLPPTGRYLAGSRVTILGGGGITKCLLPLLAPFECSTVVVRRHDRPILGADRTTTIDGLPELLPDTDLLVLALALTEETRGLIDAEALSLLPLHALLINVARGRHVVTGDLVEALATGVIGGAALDVTDPEPLPDDHPLWAESRCLITPHVANTPEMGLELLTPFVEDNVRRFLDGRPLRALVDIDLGY